MSDESDNDALPLPEGRLRPLRVEDAASIAEHADDRRIWLNLRDRFPFPYVERDALEFIASIASDEPRCQFGIEMDGAIVGGIGLQRRTDVERLSAELGYWLGARHWGRGIMTNAVRAMTAYGHERLGLQRIFALAFAWNPASVRVLDKAGYVFEGRMRRAIFKDGKITDALLYAHVLD